MCLHISNPLKQVLFIATLHIKNTFHFYIDIFSTCLNNLREDLGNDSGFN